jgi:hypothetical protein
MHARREMHAKRSVHVNRELHAKSKRHDESLKPVFGVLSSVQQENCVLSLHTRYHAAS